MALRIKAVVCLALVGGGTSLVAGCSVIAQCRIRVIRSSTLVLQAMEPWLSFALLKAFRLSSTKKSSGIEPTLESLAAQ